ncbi:unnamed protein product [Albugo candida]|uniref:Uncharacterized protein n=1 Tax=Albugo candida TaxID=65357 RepID=A0A024GE97_9STRA|nr:unnamed protein product [Albugo candida]|eukprot:CCI44840.1 unnamed protein product [Albugo candida]
MVLTFVVANAFETKVPSHSTSFRLLTNDVIKTKRANGHNTEESEPLLAESKLKDRAQHSDLGSDEATTSGSEAGEAIKSNTESGKAIKSEAQPGSEPGKAIKPEAESEPESGKSIKSEAQPGSEPGKAIKSEAQPGSEPDKGAKDKKEKSKSIFRNKKVLIGGGSVLGLGAIGAGIALSHSPSGAGGVSTHGTDMADNSNEAAFPQPSANPAPAAASNFFTGPPPTQPNVTSTPPLTAKYPFTEGDVTAKLSTFTPPLSTPIGAPGNNLPSTSPSTPVPTPVAAPGINPPSNPPLTNTPLSPVVTPTQPPSSPSPDNTPSTLPPVAST